MPSETSSLSLQDILSENGFQASIIATYSCYFPFYEEVVLRRLLDNGCTNNLLVLDAGRCAEAFAADDTRPTRAGRDYTLVPVRLRGAFHPKFIVAVGKSKGALLVGSHNLTLGGFGMNDETTNEFRTSGPGARQGAEQIRAALDYVQQFVPESLQEVRHAFGAVGRGISWLEGPVAAAANDRILMTTTGRDEALWSRLRPLVPKRPKMVFVCGPFFDKNLRFLRRLREDVTPKRLVVGIDPESVEINAAAVRQFRGAEFVNVTGLPRVRNRRQSGARYLHAKILWFAGSDSELVVSGSANPSAPAFLTGEERRNAEAVVVDRRHGAARALGLEELTRGPAVKAADWAKVLARRAARVEDKNGATGTFVLAVPADGGFLLEQPIGKKISLEAVAADGSEIGKAVTSADGQAAILAPAEVRDSAFILRGQRPGNGPVVVLVHRPDEVAKNIGGDRQRELRQALGALEEDPARLDVLLSLTEKVIFDADDVVVVDSALRRKAAGAAKASVGSSGPESLAVEAGGPRSSRSRRRLASGDILVLLDALIVRLGEGLARRSSPGGGGQAADSDEEDAGTEELVPPPQYEVLAETCRRKVGRLIRRMTKQLERARSGSALRAVVQLAAVLSVVHTLRIMEQRAEWRSKHLHLVDRDHEWDLLEAGGMALAWGSSGLAPRALKEGERELFQELSIAAGLLAWLVWDLEIDVNAELERATPIDRELDANRWYEVQLFAVVASRLAGDSEALAVLSDAVTRTARKSDNPRTWLKNHFILVDRLAQVTTLPRAATASSRPPQGGDIVLLGPTLDPRIRIALDVEPSGSTHKVTVFDRDDPDQVRRFVATHVTYVSWSTKDSVTNRVIRS